MSAGVGRVQRLTAATNLSGWRTARTSGPLEPSECEQGEVGEVTVSQGRLGLKATVSL